LATNKRPSYLKRQKEQQRVARAAEKREARRARKHSKSAGLEEPESSVEPTEIDEKEEG
jgi:hypothetical protein